MLKKLTTQVWKVQVSDGWLMRNQPLLFWGESKHFLHRDDLIGILVNSTPESDSERPMSAFFFLIHPTIFFIMKAMYIMLQNMLNQRGKSFIKECHVRFPYRCQQTKGQFTQPFWLTMMRATELVAKAKQVSDCSTKGSGYTRLCHYSVLWSHGEWHSMHTIVRQP